MVDAAVGVDANATTDLLTAGTSRSTTSVGAVLVGATLFATSATVVGIILGAHTKVSTK